MTRSSQIQQARYTVNPPPSRLPRSQFRRDHRILTAFDSGYLVPVFVDDILPGDTVNLKMHGSALMMTPLHPVMDHATLDFHWFFVPNRRTWSNWKYFLGEKDNPGDTDTYVTPNVTTSGGGFLEESLGDYLDCVPGKNRSPNAFAFRAYNQIYNQYYRHQFLQDSVPEHRDDGPDPKEDYVLLRRGKHQDYFTSCNPWPIYGDSAVLPLLDVIDVRPGGGTGNAPVYFENSNEVVEARGINGSLILNTDISPTVTENYTWPDPTGLTVDFGETAGISINDLRESVALQRLGEQFARGGARVPEILLTTFGVRSDDARQQRPEFLGGHSQEIQFTPVPQTSETNTTEQGNLAAYGTSQGVGSAITRNFTEHGILMCIASVRADQSYSQGMPRHYWRNTKEDFFWPELAHLGEMEVKQGEIYATGTSADFVTWGYQSRWDEYRFKPNTITGKMRTQASGSLSAWHLGQHHASSPVLGDAFIQENAPFDRVSAVTDEPEFKVDLFCEYRHARVMPTYSIPGQGARL